MFIKTEGNIGRQSIFLWKMIEILVENQNFYENWKQYWSKIQFFYEIQFLWIFTKISKFCWYKSYRVEYIPVFHRMSMFYVQEVLFWQIQDRPLLHTRYYQSLNFPALNRDKRTASYANTKMLQQHKRRKNERSYR